jgi:competence protein ComEC
MGRRVLRRTVLAFVVAALAAVAFPARSPAKGRLRVDFMDVGQGDAAVVTSPTGKTVLIDGGPRGAGRDLASFLGDRGVGPIDLVLLTHRHADHLGGLAEVIERRGALIFLDAPVANPGTAYAALLDVLERQQVAVRQAETGRSVDLGGGARLLLLGPPRPLITHAHSVVNANSVVARLDYGRVRVLFTGDAEGPTERWLIDAGADLRATVLKVAHHGSRTSSTAAFVDAVRPEVAVISVGGHNGFGHPAAETIDRLERAGARIYRTDLDGSITIETDGERLEVRAGRRSPYTVNAVSLQ